VGDFLVGRTIGEGTFGKVKAGVHLPSGRKVAIKILEKSRIVRKDDLARVHNELRILYGKVDHPNIIRLLELHESASSIYIITEFIEGHELYGLIVQHGRLDPKLCGLYFCQLLDAVSYLHSLGICHRDIKPENIMIDGQNLKLIDFGLSKEFGNNPMLLTSCGSPCYAAPEMLKGRAYDCIKSDIWALGVTLYAMAAGRLPFEDEDTERLYQMINNGSF
jgi:5'-AMP-activated protein kinase catalytic alpha subunit